MKKEKAKKYNAKIVKIDVFCEKCNNIVSINQEDCSFHSSSDECEMCGSHGSVELNFKCKCGLYHTIELSAW